MATNDKKIWFPAKKYGWGWGYPCAWQGWVVLAVYTLLLAVGAFLLPKRLEIWIPYAIFLSILFCLVCWRKGEKPRWRWGED